MSAGYVTLFLGLGAGAIALWIDARFPRLSPGDMGRAVLHLAASVGLWFALTPAFQTLTASEDARVTLAAVFGLAFPSVVYSLLAAVWMIKAAQQALRGHVR